MFPLRLGRTIASPAKASFFGRPGKAAKTIDVRESAARFIEQMVVALFVLDREGRVIVWNEACERLTGLEASKVIGTRDHWKGFYTAARPCLADLALEGGKAKVGSLYAAQGQGDSESGRLRAENWCDLPRGARVYLAIDAGPIRDAGGSVVAVVETLQDMTSQKLTEMAVAAERAEQANRLETVRAALGAGLAQLAHGNLVSRVETRLHEDADQLRVDFNDAIDALQDTLATIVAAAQQIRSGTEDISAATSDLSKRTQHQAASLEKTAAAVEQIAGTVKKTAEVVKHARQVVSTAKLDAEKSGQVVRQAIEAMGGIEKSSKHIVQIIGVIDEIAFQTNLLALNAGVEAARAGDAGRGFAVVASEVRALAQRSAEAAREIKALISSSTAQVDLGVDLVAQTGQALERIVAQVVEINNVVSNIAASAQEQATGLQQVDAAVSQMDQATQQNAAMAEETMAAARSLVEETEELGRLIGRFEIGPIAEPAVREAPKRPAARAIRAASSR
ncbi:MAG: methyl-accepting chemotaxis protein [Roseiarcus sp.]|jgi:methyl-accepting chemotaxis protein